MVPPIFREGATSSERRVYDALRSSALTGAALHSLNLPEHEYKQSGELDFVLVLDSLVLGIEVKGGGVSCASGVWTYSDRAGHHRTDLEGPFRQVASAMRALKDTLGARLGAQTLRTVGFGWLVITTDQDLRTSVEWAPETHLGRTSWSAGAGLDAAVHRVVAYWLDKQLGARPLDRVDRERLLGVLRPDFERVQALSAAAADLDVTFERLTEEQLRRLTELEDNDRVLFRGGAGTGKTFLAAEAARRAVARGDRVALVCRSTVLAAYLRSRALPTEVLVLDHAGLRRAVDDGIEVDYAVVDEAQDLMNLTDLDLVDRLLAGGLTEARWAFFYDANRQARLYRGYEPEGEEYLSGLGPTKLRLTRNCRNTIEIAYATRAHTGADVGIATAGQGPPVAFVDVSSDEEEAAALDAHLKELRGDGVAPGQVTVLTCTDVDGSSARRSSFWRRGRLRVVDATTAEQWPVPESTLATVREFKGLENAFIALVDLPAMDGEEALDQLYVAMSRAKAGLWVAVRPETKRQMSELFARYAPDAMAVRGDA
jgi:hypothetical protein